MPILFHVLCGAIHGIVERCDFVRQLFPCMSESTVQTVHSAKSYERTTMRKENRSGIEFVDWAIESRYVKAAVPHFF